MMEMVEIKDNILKTLNWIKSNGYVLGVPNTAAAHNCIYRGDNLLDHFSSIEAISTAVKASDFSNIFIGDYFLVDINSTLGGVETIKLVVWAINPWMNRGDTPVTTPHLALGTEDLFKTQHTMNPTNTTEGGYAGSVMFKTTLPAYATAIKNAIGASHMLKHRELLTTTINTTTPSMAGAGLTGASTGWAWTDVELTIPSEVQVYGSTVFSSSFHDVGDRNQQFPYFAARPDKLVAGLGHNGGRCPWWLSVVAGSAYFAFVGSYGDANYAGASETWVGVRPYFLFS